MVSDDLLDCILGETDVAGDKSIGEPFLVEREHCYLKTCREKKRSHVCRAAAQSRQRGVDSDFRRPSRACAHTSYTGSDVESSVRQSV
jgi:hypothetical protein